MDNLDKFVALCALIAAIIVLLDAIIDRRK